MSVALVAEQHAEAWSRATRHPFLDAVRDGSMPVAAFEVWLVQDYRFVGDLLRFQARLLARAPRPAQSVLAAGAGALADELAWFERQAATRGLELESPALPATAAYAELLGRLDGVDAAVALAGLWAIEASYLDSWSYAAPGAAAYREFVEHWTTPQFAGYVAALAEAADGAAAATATATATATAAVTAAGGTAAVVDILRAESDFWSMAWGGALSVPPAPCPSGPRN